MPITPSTIGIFQAATIAVLAAYGIDATHALAYGILLQAIEIITATVLGVPALLGERISLNDIRRHATNQRHPKRAKAEDLSRHGADALAMNWKPAPAVTESRDSQDFGLSRGERQKRSTVVIRADLPAPAELLAPATVSR